MPILEDPDTPLERAEWTLVAELEGRIVGYVAVTRSHVENLFVDPSAQGKGVGLSLLSAAEERIFGPVTLRCLHANERARRFYERQGFAVRQSQSVVFHGRRLEAWFMVKVR
jgi:ribosomal protein S18 acetylase RimI-like enzyme